MVSLGRYHSGIITNDGELYTCGRNVAGNLGDGTTEDSVTFKKIMDDVTFISFGMSTSSAITTDGDLYTWGHNTYSQLGDGTNNNHYKPNKIMSNISYVDLNSMHSAAITESGDLYTWGYNGDGELGDGTSKLRSSPQKVLSNVTMVSINNMRSSAITNNGDLYMWGYNGGGIYGDGSTGASRVPKKIMSNVETVALGALFTAIINANGDLYTWGYNNDGYLGDGTTILRFTPQKIRIPSFSLFSLAAASEEATTEQANFENLEPNTIYNFYVMNNRDAENVLAYDNLLYVSQGISDENGNISFNYISTGMDFNNAPKFVVKFKNTLPENSVSDMTITASPQKLFINVNENSLSTSGYKNIKVKVSLNGTDTFVSEYVADNKTLLFALDIPETLTNNSIISVQFLADFKNETIECQECHQIFADARCDVNADSTADLQDVTLSAQYIANWDVPVNEKILDTNGDGSIKLTDLVLLSQYVAGWDVELTANH